LAAFKAFWLVSFCQRRIDVKPIDFDAVTSAPRLFASDQRHAATEEGVEHNLTAHRAIQYRIRH
jgi:hypothetical protein